MTTDTKPAADDIPDDETQAERTRRLTAPPPTTPIGYLPQFCQVALTMRGVHSATADEVAAACGVSVRTIRNWQTKYPDFDEAMHLGKQRIVSKLVDSLYQRALGYNIQEEKAFSVNKRLRVIYVTTHIPANPACLFFALENLDPANWHNPLKMDATAKPAEVTDKPMTAEEWDKKFGRRDSAVN